MEFSALRDDRIGYVDTKKIDNEFAALIDAQKDTGRLQRLMRAAYATLRMLPADTPQTPLDRELAKLERVFERRRKLKKKLT